jgi:hypothetical protein
MMNKDEALKLALKSLEKITDVFRDTEGSYGQNEMDAIDAAYESIDAIKEVLAQGVKE